MRRTKLLMLSLIVPMMIACQSKKEESSNKSSESEQESTILTFLKRGELLFDNYQLENVYPFTYGDVLIQTNTKTQLDDEKFFTWDYDHVPFGDPLNFLIAYEDKDNGEAQYTIFRDIQRGLFQQKASEINFNCVRKAKKIYIAASSGEFAWNKSLDEEMNKAFEELVQVEPE